MKKKFIMLATAVMLTVAMAIPAMAVPSVTGTAAPEIAGSVVASDGTVLSKDDLTVTPVVDASTLAPEVAQRLETAYSKISSAGSVASFIESAPALNQAVASALANTSVSVEDLVMDSICEVTPTGAIAEKLAAGQAVDIPFAVPSLKAGQVAIVLHYNSAGEWEVVPSVTANGVVTATFTSLSPVAILVEEAAASTTASAVVSPQTGATGFETIAVAGIALCAVALFFSVKKVKA